MERNEWRLLLRFRARSGEVASGSSLEARAAYKWRAPHARADVPFRAGVKRSDVGSPNVEWPPLVHPAINRIADYGNPLLKRAEFNNMHF
jgi:hypothetical protein